MQIAGGTRMLDKLLYWGGSALHGSNFHLPDGLYPSQPPSLKALIESKLHVLHQPSVADLFQEKACTARPPKAG